MTLRSLPLTFQVPAIDVRPAPRMDDASFKQTAARFEASTLWSVMATAAKSLRESGDRDMAPALQHVQQVLHVASRDDLTLLVTMTQQLTARARTDRTRGLDVLEGLGAVGLHKNTTLAPAVRELVAALAAEVHADDLAFLLEVAAEVPGARPLVDDVAKRLEPPLMTTLQAAESPRRAAQAGDTERLRAVMDKNRDIDFRGLIHDAALWGQWLGQRSGLSALAMRAHAEMFPAFAYPHGPSTDPLKTMFDDGFVRGR